MTGERTYLDWNATAPLHPEARRAVERALDVFGNPSSVHVEGRRARAIVETARDQVAALVGARSSEVVFTSGATEACNMVLAGPWGAILRAGVEHDAVLKPAAASGCEIVDLHVGRDGIVDLADLADKVRTATATYGAGRVLLALQLANNETGVIQPLGTAAEIAREAGAVLFTDAVQAAGRVAIDFATLRVHAMAVSAHKLGGPKGIGALIVRGGFELPALLQGGGQEHRRRGGTENIPGIAGFGAAAEAARQTITERDLIAALRDRIEEGLVALTPDAEIIGATAERLANTTCVAVPGVSAETLVIRFDLAGFAISAGAACSAGKIGASSVLMAMGYPEAIARSAVRISIGPTTTDREVDRFLDAWRDIAAAPHTRTAAA
jgi:cysteine desulfurase